MRARRVFITGTDTGVGKTWVASWLAKRLAETGLRVGVYKPVCSGAVMTPAGPVWDDVERLYDALGKAFPREWICPQTFMAPLAPPHAARLERRMVNQQLLTEGAELWEGHVDVLLIEGAGGWLSPIADGMTNADVAKSLGARVLIVGANRLGVINHTRLTVESVRRAGARLVGVVLNHIPADGGEIEPAAVDFARQNIREIEHSDGTEPGATVLAALPWEGAAKLGLPTKADWRQLLKV
jgi:dethiobiotin synthetase